MLYLSQMRCYSIAYVEMCTFCRDFLSRFVARDVMRDVVLDVVRDVA